MSKGSSFFTLQMSLLHHIPKQCLHLPSSAARCQAPVLTPAFQRQVSSAAVTTASQGIAKAEAEARRQAHFPSLGTGSSGPSQPGPGSRPRGGSPGGSRPSGPSPGADVDPQAAFSDHDEEDEPLGRGAHGGPGGPTPLRTASRPIEARGRPKDTKEDGVQGASFTSVGSHGAAGRLYQSCCWNLQSGPREPNWKNETIVGVAA